MTNLLSAGGIWIGMVLIFALTSHFLRKSSLMYAKDLSPSGHSAERYRLYFLTLAIYLPVTEFALHLFKVRSESELVSNLMVSAICLLNFLNSRREGFFRKYLSISFMLVYSAAMGWTITHMISDSVDIVSISEFSLFLMFAYYVYPSVSKYLWVAGILATIFFGAAFLGHIQVQELLLIEVILIITTGINFSRHIIDSHVDDQLQLAFSASNTGSVYSIGLKSNGQIVFMSSNCRKLFSMDPDAGDVNIEQLLRLTPEQTERLLSENNQHHLYEYSQTNDTMLNILWQKGPRSGDVILLIGTDVTEGTQLRQRLQTANNRLEDLLRHSGDIVMVLDSQYRITELFDNQKILFQQRASHFIHKGIDELVFSDDARKILVDTLDTACLSGRNAEAQFKYLRENKTLWFNFRVSTMFNQKGHLEEIVCIFRNISQQKEEEFKKEKRARQIELYNKILVKLSSTNIDSFGTYEEACREICKLAAHALGISGVSIWDYDGEALHQNHLFQMQANRRPTADPLPETLYPVYFSTIKNGLSIVADDANNHPHTREFSASYFKTFDVQSSLDVPIRANGQLVAVICCEQVGQIKKWSHEDESFVRMLGDILSIIREQHLRRETQTALDRTKLLKQRSMEMAELGIWEIQLSNGLTYWSDVMCKIFELPADYETHAEALFEFILSDEKRIHIQHQYLRLVELGKPFDEEFQIQTFENHIHWVRCMAQAEFENGTCMRTFGVIQQIDARMQQHQQLIQVAQTFQSLSRSIDDVMWLFNLKSEQFEFVSESCIKLFGCKPEDFYQNPKQWQQYIHPADRDKVNNAHESRTKEHGFEISYRIIAEGQEKWVFEKCFPVKNEAGEIIRYSGTIREIDEPNPDLNHQSAAKSPFNESAIHPALINKLIYEIQEPLYGTLGLTEMTAPLELNEQQRTYIENLKDSANRSLLLMNNVEDYLHLNNAEIRLNAVPTFLNRLLDELKANMHFPAGKKNLELDFRLDPQLPFQPVSIDTARIRQILFSILNYAIRNMYDGRIQLSIQAVDLNNPLQNIRFEIVEYRKEFSEEDMQQLNELMQHEISDKHKVKDTGLGLHVSHRLLNMMGAGLFIEGIKDQGIRYSFELKPESIGDRTMEEPELKASSHEQQSRQSKSVASARGILLAEGNPVNMFFAKSILARLRPELEIFEAKNSEEVLHILQTQIPQLLILDLGFLENDQLLSMQQIRDFEMQRGTYSPIIGTTAMLPDEAARFCKQAGMDDFISKPVKAATLEKLLNTWLPVLHQQETKNKEKTTEPPIDFVKLQDNMSSDESYPNVFMPFIRQALQDYLKELYTHFVNHDLTAIHQIAQKLYGMANLGCFPNLQALSSELMKKNHFEESSLGQLLTQIDNEIERVLAVI